MYNPISADDDDEYVELYNRGPSAVDLSGWSFLSGIEFTFPQGTRMSPESYLVLARNAARLRTNYTNLDGRNTFGDFTGRLSNGGAGPVRRLIRSLSPTSSIRLSMK
jgi:hypothetical protein